MSTATRPLSTFEPPPSLRRRLTPWILATALLVLAAMSITQFIALRNELQAQVTGQLEGQIEDRVAAWEERWIERLDDAVSAVNAPNTAPWRLEAQLQARDPWIDAIYAWKPRRLTASERQLRAQPAELIFPRAPFSERQSGITTAACLRAVTSEDSVERARSYLTQCRREPLPVRMYAASEAAVLLARSGRFPEALEALAQSGVDPTLDLRAGVHELGLDPYRLAVLRLQRADYLLRSGSETEGLDLYATTAQQITRLDSTELGQLLTFVRKRALPELRHHRREDLARPIEEGVARAERRQQAYQELTDRILPLPPRTIGEAPRLVYDQYSRVPFLLYYGYNPDGTQGAAIQLDQPLLLEDFVSDVRRYRADLVIVDNAGELVLGTPSESPIAIQVPFPKTLTHLRVGLRATAVEARMKYLDDQWIVPLVIVGFCVSLGILALVAQLRADRRLQQLLLRQREFTARVTHELKTPLAGIRVMAENLEAGAFESAEDQRSMARSIVRESDRLTTRVDEILAVARERRIPDPEPFDPEEAALEAIDLWGPRLEQSGVRLEADLHATDAVLGDSAAIRDALGCLLDNALKYRQENAAPPRVWLHLLQEENFVIFEVIDNGIGVPHDLRTAIFERFVRVEGPNRGRAGGHGLGLAQVAEIARSHSGSVECTDGVGGGSRFRMKLPAYQT
jgi:signal transduction histidine kinase